MTDDKISSTIQQPSRGKFIATVADSIPIIIAVLFFALLFALDRSNQAELDAEQAEFEAEQAELDVQHEARMSRLRAEHEARMTRFHTEAEERDKRRHAEREARQEQLRLVGQLRAMDAKQGK